MMGDKSTDELNKILEEVKPNNISQYIKDNKDEINDATRAFYYYFKDTLDTKGIMLKDVYSFAGVSESWGGQVIRMERPSRNRDTIIKLCLAGHFNLTEMNRALKLYGMKELYARNTRDICIIVAINNRVFQLDKVDDILKEHGQEILSNEIE